MFWSPSKYDDAAAMTVAASGGGGGFSITAGGYAESGTGSTTNTFSTVNIGTANANRQVVIALCIRSASSLASIAVTVDYGTGPQPASNIIDSLTAASQDTSLWQVAAPTGTTATVVVIVGVAPARLAIQAYSVVTATPTVSATHASTSATAPSHTLIVPAGGGMIFVAQGSTGITTFTPTNFTTDHAASIAASPTWLAAGHDASHSGSTVFTGTWNTAVTSPGSVGAAWAP